MGHWRWYLAKTRGPFDFIFFLIQEFRVFRYFSRRGCWWVISFPHPTFNRTSNRIISFYYWISRIKISNQFAAWEISRLFFTCIALISIFLSFKSGLARLYEKCLKLRENGNFFKAHFREKFRIWPQNLQFLFSPWGLFRLIFRRISCIEIQNWKPHFLKIMVFLSICIHFRNRMHVKI